MKILVIEDDKNLSDALIQCLKKDYDTVAAYDGFEGYTLAKEDIYDAIVLDVMMPEMDGYEVAFKLRQKGIFTPILMLTAKSGVESKVQGFDSGADDYLTKPFAREELLARLGALIRRNKGIYKEKELVFLDLTLNLKNRQVKIFDEVLNIQGKQFDILEYLINSKETIVTKEQIFDKIWGYNSETVINVVEVYTSALRKELKKFGYDRYIKTVRGIGYILSER